MINKAAMLLNVDIPRIELMLFSASAEHIN
jgi:hypothetical protein